MIEIAAEDIGRILWLLAGLFGFIMVTLTLRVAYKDHTATVRSNASKSDRIVARMLGKREILLWFTQFAGIVVAIAALALPEQTSARQVALALSNLTVGCSSVCWWYDRRQFRKLREEERSKEGIA